MLWQLQVYTPDGATLLGSYANAQSPGPGGILGFEIERDPVGDPLVMTFEAVPSLTPYLDLRNIVKLTVDNTPVFWGYLETTWNASIDHPRTYRALGGRKLVQYAVMDKTAFNTPTSLTTIFQSLAGALLPAAITYDANRVASVSTTAVLRPSEGARLDKVFDALAAMMGSAEWRWGVDATGTFYFEQYTGTTDLTGALVTYDHEGADRLITGVTFVFAQTREGVPIAWSYAGAKDGTYQMRRSYAVDPDAALRVAQVTGAADVTGDGTVQGETWSGSWTSNNDLSYLTDYSTHTRWRTFGDVGAGATCQAAIRFFGAEFAVSATNPQALYIRAQALEEQTGGNIVVELRNAGNSVATFSLGTDVDEFLDVRGLTFDAVRVGVISGCFNIARWNIGVYELRLYYADSRTEAIAASFIQDPQDRPTVATWQGYKAPTLYVDDGSGAQLADGWTHTLQIGKWETKVNIKPPGDANARAVVNYVERRLQDARLDGGMP